MVKGSGAATGKTHTHTHKKTNKRSECLGLRLFSVRYYVRAEENNSTMQIGSDNILLHIFTHTVLRARHITELVPVRHRGHKTRRENAPDMHASMSNRCVELVLCYYADGMGSLQQKMLLCNQRIGMVIWAFRKKRKNFLKLKIFFWIKLILINQ